MGRLIVNEWMSLDGVAQAPSYPDEDTDGNFQHGGWHTPFSDDQSMTWVGGSAGGRVEALAERRRRGTATRPTAEKRPKYVASTTLTEPLTWRGARLLRGDLATAVATLKADEEDIHVIGSTQLVQALIRHHLFDELRLMIDPLLLGAGKRFLPDHDTRLDLQLQNSQVTATGAILATYVKREEGTSGGR